MADHLGDSEVAMRLGRNLLLARRQAGCSQEELARRCCLHPTYISHLERGARLPRVGTLMRLACSLEVSADELLRGIEWVPPPTILRPPGSFAVAKSQ